MANSLPQAGGSRPGRRRATDIPALALRAIRIPVQIDIVISTGTMAQLIVRDLEEDVKRRLKRRARRHGRSTEAEVREILRAAVASESGEPSRLGSRIAERFSQTGLEQPIAELRGNPAKAAQFKK